MLKFIEQNISEKSDPEITFADFAALLPPAYVDYMEAEWETAHKGGMTEEKLREILFDPSFELSFFETSKPTKDFYYHLTEEYVVHLPNGMAVGLCWDFPRNIMIRVGLPAIDDVTGKNVRSLAGTNYDYCGIWLRVSQEGIQFTSDIPRIFAAVSGEYERWSSYYGDPGSKIKGKHPENRLVHSRGVLEMARMAVSGSPYMTPEFFLYTKEASFRLFNEPMPGVVGWFHEGTKRAFSSESSLLLKRTLLLKRLFKPSTVRPLPVFQGPVNG